VDLVTDIEWDLEPGAEFRRQELRNRFGGNQQAGIAPLKTSPNVLVFTNPAKGPEHGYYNRWVEDGSFHYTGQGQKGDQSIDSYPNRDLLNHGTDDRALRLFEATDRSGWHRYVGEMEVDPADPYHLDRAPETGGGPIRSVIMFHLLPTGRIERPRTDSLGIIERTTASVSDLEAHNTERYLARPNTETIEKERREQGLVQRYAEYLRSRGSDVVRYTYQVGSSRLACDGFDVTNNVLIEAKSSTDRNSIRLAVGQLYDYRRFHDPEPTLRILLPRSPGPDLIDYLHMAHVEVAYPDGSGFAAQPAAKKH
jgi:hypothetical protein